MRASSINELSLKLCDALVTIKSPTISNINNIIAKYPYAEWAFNFKYIIQEIPCGIKRYHKLTP